MIFSDFTRKYQLEQAGWVHLPLSRLGNIEVVLHIALAASSVACFSRLHYRWIR